VKIVSEESNILGEILSMVYKTVDAFFGPIFHITSDPNLNAILGVMIISILVSAAIVGITSKVVDQNKMKSLKSQVAVYQDDIKKAQKRKDLKKISSIQKEMMSHQKSMMMVSMRPMMFTMLPILVIFTWLRQYEVLLDFISLKGYLVALPFTLPKFGSTLGWLGWYILCSFPMSILIKKLFKLEGP
tara:strand:- start:905 stop:1465 length:561 start_codon:yes stop_codon:yes gene_type:complete